MQQNIFRYAAIDIGSNAVRLLLCNVAEESDIYHFKKSELVRIPLRLGEDVFQSKRISFRKMEKFVKTMHAFYLLIDVFNPMAYRACATASLREAENGAEIVNRIKKEIGLRIEIISGKEEAELIYSNHVEDMLDKKRSYLYIDVGGGSTEITLFDRNKVVGSQSFNIGTIRCLKGKVTKDSWESMKSWVKEITQGYSNLTAIGSGGNINKLLKILERKDKVLSFSLLKNLYDELKIHTLEERMEIWQLNPDRADVIVPAAKIFLSIMKAAGIQDVIVPQVGLADGIVHQLHEELIRSKVS